MMSVTTAGTSTRTPMSTALLTRSMPSRSASAVSQAEPSRPGAAMTTGLS